MLKGQGTPEDPLHSRRYELYDISSMIEEQTDEEGIMIIIRDVTDDELHPMFFSYENFKEFAERGLELITNLTGN